MSFRTSSGELGRAFERVRRSLLQADELPFANVLTTERLAEASRWRVVSDTGTGVYCRARCRIPEVVPQWQALGGDEVTRLHQLRETDIRRSHRLGCR